MKTLAVALVFAALGAVAQTKNAAAQKLVDEIKAAHPEITGLELAAKTPGAGCQTIAATEAKEVGEKCDDDEFTAWNTNKPFIEQEKEEFDVTLPIHDSSGKVIATAGMDFKRQAGRTKETVAREAQKIGAEIERRLAAEPGILGPA
jgi:hypothetical protein